MGAAVVSGPVSVPAEGGRDGGAGGGEGEGGVSFGFLNFGLGVFGDVWGWGWWVVWVTGCILGSSAWN